MDTRTSPPTIALSDLVERVARDLSRAQHPATLTRCAADPDTRRKVARLLSAASTATRTASNLLAQSVPAGLAHDPRDDDPPEPAPAPAPETPTQQLEAVRTVRVAEVRAEAADREEESAASVRSILTMCNDALANLSAALTASEAENAALRTALAEKRDPLWRRVLRSAR